MPVVKDNDSTASDDDDDTTEELNFKCLIGGGKVFESNYTRLGHNSF